MGVGEGVGVREGVGVGEGVVVEVGVGPGAAVCVEAGSGLGVVATCCVHATTRVKRAINANRKTAARE